MEVPTESGFRTTIPRGRPVVVVEDLHVEYRVYATGKRVGTANNKLFKRRRQVQVVHALRGISFTVHENESVGIIGHNGSGKSTLMRAIAGLTPSNQGVIYTASRPNLLGVGSALIKDLSGAQNITLGSLAMGFGREETEAMHDNIIEFSGLREFIDMPMRTYSSGMAQRLKFSIASARAHDILIIDEALAVGDRKFREKSEERIQEIIDAAGTVIVVSHSMRTINRICDRVIWLDHGKVKMDGPTDDIVSAYLSDQ